MKKRVGMTEAERETEFKCTVRLEIEPNQIQLCLYFETKYLLKYITFSYFQTIAPRRGLIK